MTKRVLPVLAVIAALGMLPAAASSTAPAAAITTPIKAAFYYPWFPETRYPDDVAQPSLGNYDSSNRTILATHVSEAKYAGLDAFISSWWGPGTPTDQRLPLLLDAAKAQDFHIAAYYEPEGTKDPTVEQIQQDLVRLKALADQYGDTWQRVNGKPVLFVYNSNDRTCAIVDKWKQAAPDWYVNLKVFSGYRTCPSQPDSWHQYAPTSAIDRQTPNAVTISPGFWFHKDAAPRLARDPVRFAQNVADWNAAAVQWKLVTTFNEEGEGSMVEPATAWESPSGFGTYLDILHGVPLPPPPPPDTTTTTVAPTTTTAPQPPPTTAPPAADVKIAAAGDIACPSPDVGAASCAQGRVSDVILDEDPDAVLTLGDTQYDNGELANLQAFYDPTFGRFKAKTFPAIGNHEYLTAVLPASRRTSPTGSHPTAGPTTRTTSVRGTSRRSTPTAPKVGGCNVGNPEYTWLQQDLAANDGKPTVIYWHHPRWSSGQHGDNVAMAPVWNLLTADPDVQITLAGHDHDYERFARMGTGGPDAERPSGVRRGHGREEPLLRRQQPQRRPGRFDCSSFGALMLTLHADGAWDWRFVPATGTFTDSGSEVHR
jgi:hypothetical protein